VGIHTRRGLRSQGSLRKKGSSTGELSPGRVILYWLRKNPKFQEKGCIRRESTQWEGLSEGPNKKAVIKLKKGASGGKIIEGKKPYRKKTKSIMLESLERRRLMRTQPPVIETAENS